MQMILISSFRRQIISRVQLKSTINRWAAENNLAINRRKSVEIVFVLPRSRRVVDIPPPAVPSITRVDSIKALGVSITRTFSVTLHVEHLLASCAQSIFALRTLRSHGAPTNSLQAIFQATVVAKLSYASSAWWGFANQADRNRLESFLRRSERLGYREPARKTLSDICDLADSNLFNSIKNNESHLLYPLLPPKRSQHYALRQRVHPFQLTARTTALNDNNFIMRMLYNDLNRSVFS